MKELIVPIFLFGLADSLNPATIAVAAVLATGRRPVPRLLMYTLGTGVTYFLGGLVLVLGPKAEPLLEKLRGFVARWGHRLLALLTGGGGAYILLKGVIGLGG